MPTYAFVFLLAVVCGVAAIYAHSAVQAWRRWRGVRLVTCPETSRAAAVTVDAMHAAATAVFDNAPDIRLAACSRWAARGVCRQPCLRALTLAGDAATVRSIVKTWYSSHNCAFCGQPVRRVLSRGRPTAFLGPDGTIMEWYSFPPDRLPDLFDTQRAVCFNCHLAESFRRLNPNLYVDRDRTAVRH